MTPRRLILVSGAPRSGTTPIGRVLTMSQGTGTLYEPMGTTGDRRFDRRFPMPGESGFSEQAVAPFLDDLRALRLNFKPQERPAHRSKSSFFKLFRRLTGTRSLNTYRLCRLQWNLSTIVWKDPMAAFAIPAVARAGIPVVVTARPPHAHAASYVRTGWKLDVRSVYERYRALHGPVEEVEAVLRREPDSTILQSAILWHLIYTRVLHASGCPALTIVDSLTLEQDEPAIYRRLYDRLGLIPTRRYEKYLSTRRGGDAAVIPAASQTHEWTRSLSETNSYWKTLLTPAQVEVIESLNGALWARLQHISIKRYQ